MSLNSTLCLAAVLVAAVAAVTILLLLLLRRRRRADLRSMRAAQRSQPVDLFRDTDADVLQGDPRALKAGDILETQGDSLVVRGTLRMREGGYRWAEHLIDTGTGRREWLSVEEDPELALVLWREVEDEVPPPGPRTIEWAGATYQLEESGQAEYVSEATTGLAPTGRVRYFDYRAADGSLLSYEDFKGSGSYEVATGQRLAQHEVTIYARGAQ